MDMINDGSKKIYSISELTLTIKFLLESKLQSVSVKGEISNFKKQSSGHLYFSLKDKDSQIAAAFFKGNCKNLSKEPKDGDQVIAKGEISVYPPRGIYQLIVREITFLGVGELLIKLHELKEELKALGFFDPKHKKKLPKLPKTIGVVTSPTGAVIQDIINILNRRYFNFHLILNPVKVQGTKAAEEIAQAIDEFNKYDLADVLIIGRGGGTLEDLWPFNEKIVAEAIFQSKIPIISAVGHETDFTIADFVADVRAPTPSSAAEIVTSERSHLIKNLQNYQNQIFTSLNGLLKHERSRLNFIASHPLFSSTQALLFKPMQQLDEIRNVIESTIKYRLSSKKELLNFYLNQFNAINPKNHLRSLSEKLNSYRKNIDSSIKIKFSSVKKEFYSFLSRNDLQWYMQNFLKLKNSNLEKLISHLKSLDPKEILKKGYSILFSEKEHSIILSSKSVCKNDQIIALLHDGKIKATVEVIDD